MALTVQERARTTETRAVRRRNNGLPIGWLVGVVVMGGLGAYHWLIYTPRPDIPHRLTILDMLFRVGVAGAIVLLGLLVGLRLLRPLRITAHLSRLQRLALGAALGLGALSLFTFVLGILRLYYTLVFAALLTGGPLLFPTERRWLAAIVKGALGAARARERRPLTFERLACRLLGAISLGAMALFYLRDLTLPDGGPGYDSYQYHWAIPELLLRAHAWQGFPGWAHANLPFNTEMLNLIAISLRAPTAANIVQDTFLALFGVLLFDLTRRHFGPVVAWFAAASPVTIPLLVAYTSQSFVETAVMCYALAALTLLLLWHERRLGASRAGFEVVGLAGAFLGFAVASKYTAIELAPGLLLVLAFGCLALVRGPDGRAWKRRVALQGLTFLVGVGVVMALWFLKNWIYLSNPVYPALGGLFADPLWNAARDQTLTSTFQHFGPHTGVVARWHLYWLDLFFDPAPYHENGPFSSGQLGLVALLAAPVLVVGWRRGWLTLSERRRGQMLVIGGLAAVSFGGMLAWSFSGALVSRYALPQLVLMTALGALLAGWMMLALLEWAKTYNGALVRRLSGVLSTVVLLVVLIGLVNQAFSHLFLNLRGARNAMPLLTASMSEDQYRLTKVGGGMKPDYWQMVSYVNTQLPHDGKLLMLARGSGYFFSNREYVADSGGDWIPYLITAGKTPDGIVRLLRSRGFTYVVYDDWLMQWLEHGYENRVLRADAPLFLAFQQHYLIPIASWGNVSLYRVPEVSGG